MADTEQEQTPLAEWRSRMGWSQRKAAEALGVAYRTYQSWEWEKSHNTGEPMKPPKPALLAAAALENGLGPVE